MSRKPKVTGGPDRRAYPRNPVLVCEARCISGIDVFFGHAMNVSRGGMFISTAKMRSPGAEYEIQFKLPGLEHSFRCRARVVWHRPYRHGSPLSPGFGLQFLDLTEEDSRIIDDWVLSVEDPS